VATASMLYGPDGLPLPRATLHSKQHEIIVDPHRFKTAVFGRRFGKSHLGGVRTWIRVGQLRAQRREGLMWIVAPTQRHLRTNWLKVIRAAPRGAITTIKGTSWHPDSIVSGGITIEFRSAHNPENLVGEGLLDLWLDECGLIKERTWVESLRPTLADFSAPALFTGTPKGRNWFYRMAMRGLSTDPEDAEYAHFTGPSHENPFIDADELLKLEADMREMSVRTYRQEILAEFLSGEGAVFGDVRACMERTGGKYSLKKTIVIGADLARKRDWTVFIGLDEDGNVTFFQRWRNIDWPIQKSKLLALWQAHGFPWLVIDSTGVGDPFVQEIKLVASDRVDEFVFSPKSKAILVEGLIVAVEQKLLGLPDEPILLNELEAYEFRELPSGALRYEAPEGLHDDVVMALGLAWRGHAKGAGIAMAVERASVQTQAEYGPVDSQRSEKESLFGRPGRRM
jgi:hypothetical protein